jgi:hypothetical protein
VSGNFPDTSELLTYTSDNYLAGMDIEFFTYYLIALCFIVPACFFTWYFLKQRDLDRASPEQRLEMLHGPRNNSMICPHCQEKGMVRVRSITVEHSLTVAPTQATKAYCESCEIEWTIN